MRPAGPQPGLRRVVGIEPLRGDPAELPGRPGDRRLGVRRPEPPGIGAVKGGPGKLKDIEDPFGNGPFEFRALDKGFELKSKLLYKGQPVMLTVGRGK